METDHTLKKFDDLTAIVLEAKDLYVQKKYQDAYDATKKALRLFRRAEDQVVCHIYMKVEDERELTEEEESKLVGMNAVLADLEKKITVEVDRIRGLCEQRLASPQEPFLQDYEMDVEMAFYVREDHPACNHDLRDGVIAVPKFVGRMDIFRIDEDWNDHSVDDRDRHHCWILHSLYVHTSPPLSWHDILQINHVSVDVVVPYQRFDDL